MAASCAESADPRNTGLGTLHHGVGLRDRSGYRCLGDFAAAFFLRPNRMGTGLIAPTASTFSTARFRLFDRGVTRQKETAHCDFHETAKAPRTGWRLLRGADGGDLDVPFLFPAAWAGACQLRCCRPPRSCFPGHQSGLPCASVLRSTREKGDSPRSSDELVVFPIFGG